MTTRVFSPKTSKTLGQINYERFTPEWVTPLVPWHEVPVQEQRRWEAAAQAVWRYVVLNEKCIHAPKREAVIEAARLAASISYPSHVEKYAAIQGLRATVRALDKAEDEP